MAHPPITPPAPNLGAFPTPDGTTFRAWSTRAAQVSLCLDGQLVPMTRVSPGLYEVTRAAQVFLRAARASGGTA